ncbi:GrpB family protein [Chitinophaga sp. Cy-1792]|uniref:GrpB family protein n=1 Tax=Chitinophaga sp. Cy-1792 TaxID=2608339 RepID=UPI001422B319|nr:GrpB family protein [Chitinophaga sp. Cy-1792]NIG55984.1 GrpB family protein [Chitinophaga sp. Cy-1792]
MQQKITVVPYQPEWPLQFAALAAVYRQALGPHILAVEHVGSTAVPGLPAKPILDIDLVIETEAQLPFVNAALEKLGYQFRGDLGIKNRYAYGRSSDNIPHTPEGRQWPAHHLYCCIKGAASLQNHLLLRDTLRNNQELKEEYARIKERLAATVNDDIDAYVEGKSDFIAKVLLQGGFHDDDISDIREQNRKK